MKLYAPSRQKNRKPEVKPVLNDWSAGYMSYAEAIRARKNALVDMTNMDLTQNGIPTVRPGTSKYGVQPLGKVIGVGTFVKFVSGASKPERHEITMQVIDGKGQVCIRKDGGSWNIVGGNYSTTAWTTFTQSNSRVYASNKENKMSFYDIKADTIVIYSPVSTPATPTVAQTGLTGTTVTYRVRVSANNNVGETAASTAALITISAYRNTWDPNTQYITITADTVAGAESYNFYLGTVAGEEQFLGNVPKPSSGTTVTFKDNNRVAINPFKKAPEGNSTEGPILGTMIASAGQLFGVDDKDNPYRYWYSGTGDKAGDFSPFNGGGWVDINLGGDSVPVAVRAFRDGRGTSAVTILTRGAAGKGELYHQTFEQQAIGDYTITFPSIQQANGQAGTYSAMAVVEANNSLHYPTGTAFKTTGTKAQMVNILVTDNISDTIEPDVKRLNLIALHKAVGLEHDNRIFWCLPVGSNSNNEIWIHDISQRGAWILRWTIKADFMWLYEDNNGITHHCVLVGNKILEFNKTMLTDDGTPFRTRLALATTTFDESGLQMAHIEKIRLMLLRPRGNIKINVYGLGEDSEAVASLTNAEINPVVNRTGWSDFLWSKHMWSEAFGAIKTSSKTQLPVSVEVDEVVSQITCDITSETPATYSLNSVKFSGKIIPKLYQGDE